MPLRPGIKNMRANYKELMSGVESPGREKAILTIMKNRKMTREEAMHTQALAIVKAQARKK